MSSPCCLLCSSLLCLFVSISFVDNCHECQVPFVMRAQSRVFKAVMFLSREVSFPFAVSLLFCSSIMHAVPSQVADGSLLILRDGVS